MYLVDLLILCARKNSFFWSKFNTLIMRKIIPLFLISTVVFVGCKKNYTCYCTKTVVHPGYSYNNVDYPETVETSVEYVNNKGKENSLKAECDFKSYTIQQSSTNPGQPDLTIVNACQLKADNGKPLKSE